MSDRADRDEDSTGDAPSRFAPEFQHCGRDERIAMTHGFMERR